MWSAAVDSAGIATSASVIAVRRKGLICGIDAKNGHELWCATRGAKPVHFRDSFVYLSPDGNIHAVGAADGALHWMKQRPAARSADIIAAPEIWSLDDHLIFAMPSRHRMETFDYGELDARGTVLWTVDRGSVVDSPTLLARTTDAGELATQPGIGGGATTTRYQSIFVLRGSGSGGLLAQLDLSEILTIQYPLLIGTHDINEPIEDHFLGVDVLGIDLRTNHQLFALSLRPHYSENLAAYERGAFAPGTLDANATARFGRAWLFVPIGPRLYAYRMSGDSFTGPTLVASQAHLIDVDGDIAIGQQPDGIYEYRLKNSGFITRRILRTAATVVSFLQENDLAYFALDDRTIRMVDLGSGDEDLIADTCESPEIAAVQPSLLVLCGSNKRTLFAFAITKK
jgi:hypothetical protein